MSKKTKQAKPFPGQHDGESVELVFRQHPVVMRYYLIYGLLAILVAVTPLLIWPLSNLAIEAALGAPLLVLLYWFYHWIGWFYSIYVVTNERIIEIKQSGLFNRRVTEFGLDKIQNVNYHITGLEAVVLHYGNITVQTYVGDLEMKKIHKPVHVHKEMVDIIRRYVPQG
jgi:hypothetical protein